MSHIGRLPKKPPGILPSQDINANRRGVLFEIEVTMFITLQLFKVSKLSSITKLVIVKNPKIPRY